MSTHITTRATSGPATSVEGLGFDAERLARVRAHVVADIEAGRCHGVSMIVARRGEIVLNLTEGYANLADHAPLQSNSVFATMSVAKQFTNVLALSLVERGLLKLHAPVAELIPDFATLGKEKVNLFHLLTHTSGILSAIPPVKPDVLMSIEELTKFACALPLESQPGERVNYSILLGHTVIAAMCLKVDGRGRSYTDMLREDLFDPLAMRDTSLGVRDDLAARLCPVKVSYENIPALLPPEAVEGLGSLLATPGCEIPGGGCITSIQDLHRFAEMLRRRGELDGVRILSPAMLDFCTRNHTGELRNILFDMWSGTRNWTTYAANIGVGFFMRGEGNLAGVFSPMNSPRTYGGIGAGSTAFTVDPERELSFTFLSTGLMEDSYHVERVGALASIVLAAITD
ncbi:MAG: CubicO group peptidase (beta-lactamase class C family) [Gammaproteobacteria bacterium]|jgi:CubicO group peptidase (beta-lactamase class C family)